MILGRQRLQTRVSICVNTNSLFIVVLTNIHFLYILVDGQVQCKSLLEVIKYTIKEIDNARYGKQKSYKVSLMSYHHADAKVFQSHIISYST